MKIAIISDSHYDECCVNSIKKHLNDVDILIHCGDGAPDTISLAKDFKGEIYAVRGNCDISNKYPDERIIDIHGIRILITHGHKYNVKCEYNTIFYKGKESNVDIVFFGHSHRALISEFNGLTIMNPGSITLPYGGAKKTIGFMEINKGDKPKLYIKEI